MRYSAKRVDSGSKSLDMGARRYDAAASRFLQFDQFNGALADLGLSMDPLTSNRFALEGGNPITYIECDGHLSVPNGVGGSATCSPVVATRNRARGTTSSPPTPAAATLTDQYFGMGPPPRKEVNPLIRPGPTPMGPFLQPLPTDQERFMGLLQLIEETENSNDDFVREAGYELGGVDAGRFMLWEDAPGGLSRVRSIPQEVVGTSGWNPNFVDNDESPARHFIGWIVIGYFHPISARTALKFQERPGAGGESEQDIAAGHAAIDVGIALRREDIDQKSAVTLIDRATSGNHRGG